MKNSLLLILIVLTAITLKLQSQTTGTFTDNRDGKTYKTVVIGNQTWMAENLNYETASSSCYYENVINCKYYGRLYDWQTAASVCPAGWQLPSKSDFDTLLFNYGGEGNNAYNNLIIGGNSGFSALFGGFLNVDGIFYFLGGYGGFWSNSHYDENNGSTKVVLLIRGADGDNEAKAYMGSAFDIIKYSVRCIYK
ncbi:MAG: FISUMP domain-containing protein [Clostridia bacterium]|nr:FISUMP domain-containing protein [Clostridia bacterium]